MQMKIPCENCVPCRLYGVDFSVADLGILVQREGGGSVMSLLDADSAWELCWAAWTLCIQICGKICGRNPRVCIWSFWVVFHFGSYYLPPTEKFYFPSSSCLSPEALQLQSSWPLMSHTKWYIFAQVTIKDCELYDFGHCSHLCY